MMFADPKRCRYVRKSANFSSPLLKCFLLSVGDDEEDDPLDAYMKSLEKQAKTKGKYISWVFLCT